MNLEYIFFKKKFRDIKFYLCTKIPEKILKIKCQVGSIIKRTLCYLGLSEMLRLIDAKTVRLHRNLRFHPFASALAFYDMAFAVVR